MADKLAPLILAALARVAAEPEGLPLFNSRAETGLFPTTALARTAARKSLEDGLIALSPDVATAGKSKIERCRATDAGLRYLVEAGSPKQVLEDFVRILEQRQSEVRELLATAARMAVGLERLAEIVGGIMPKVEETRVTHVESIGKTAIGGTDDLTSEPLLRSTSHTRKIPEEHANGVHSEDYDATILTLPFPTTGQEPERTHDGVARQSECRNLEEEVLAALHDWTAKGHTAGDCPLPELCRVLGDDTEALTVGRFHDAIRELHAERRIYLHPWTGPLYTLPEPRFALLVGHEVAYYASPR